MTKQININHVNYDLPLDLTRRLLDFIRIDCGLTATKESCQEGECGACLVLVDGEIYNSCLLPVGNLVSKSVITLECFSKSKIYKAIENAYLEEGAVQCGFCTPGMVMATYALLKKNSNHTLESIRLDLSGNLCRCTGYQTIFKAIEKLIKEGVDINERF